MQPFFIWNNENSLARHIWLEHHPPIIRAEERVQHITIPGRAGDMTIAEGEDIYEPYLQSVTICANGRLFADEAKRWLRGSGLVTFSSEPDKVQAARIINSVTLEKVSRNLDAWTGDLVFYCQPYKRLIHEQTETIASGGSIVNLGDIAEKPLITVTGTGTLSISIDGGAAFEIADVTAAQGGVVIDCEAMEAISPDGSELMTAQTSGAFPVIPVGTHTITLTGADSAVIGRKMRWV